MPGRLFRNLMQVFDCRPDRGYSCRGSGGSINNRVEVVLGLCFRPRVLELKSPT